MVFFGRWLLLFSMVFLTVIMAKLKIKYSIGSGNDDGDGGGISGIGCGDGNTQNVEFFYVFFHKIN